MFLNILTRFLIFFSLLSPLSLILLKKMFCNSVLKVRFIAVLKKDGAFRPILLHTQKSFAGQL